MSDIDINQVLSQMRSMAIEAKGVGTVTPQQPATGGAEFGAMLNRFVDGVNTTQKEAGQMRDAFVNGSSDADLTEVMIALQKASVSFQAMTEVRNKLINAYHEVMKMQV